MASKPSSEEKMARRVDELEQRLELLETERQILDTVNRYGDALDYGRDQEFAELFTRDGVFDVFYANGERLHRDQGREQLARYVAAQDRAPSWYEKHLIHSPRITLKGSEAQVDSFFTALRDEGAGPVVHVYGTYRDRFVKEEGRWRIKERVARIEALRSRPSVQTPGSE